MAKLRKNRKWNETVRIDDVSFDSCNSNDCAIQAMVLREARGGNFENVGNLLQLASAMSVDDNSREPIMTRTVRSYTLTKDGKTSVVTSDAAMKSLVNNGFECIEVNEKTIDV